MEAAAPLDLALIAQARTVIARLELVSHGRTVNLGPSGGTGEPLFPPGGIAGRDDREPDQPHKSHLHYRRRLHGCRTDDDLRAVIDDAADTLAAWKKSAPPPENSVSWQEQIANDTRKAAVVAKHWNVKKEYVWMLRRKFGTNARHAA